MVLLFLWSVLLSISSKIATFIYLIPIIVALLNYKQLNKPLKLFLIYSIIAQLAAFLLISFIWFVDNYTKFSMPYLEYWKISDTNFLGIIAHLNNFIFLGLYFSLLLPIRLIKPIAITLSVFAFINYLFIEGYNVYGTFNPIASVIFSFILPAIQSWFLFTKESKVSISKNPYFWICIGLLFPNITTLFLEFSGSKIYSTDYDLFCKISVFSVLTLIIGKIFIAIGFYYARYTEYLHPQTTSNYFTINKKEE
jgi:hypothetical protein